MVTKKDNDLLKSKAYNILVKNYGYEYDDYDNPYDYNFWYTLSRNTCRYEPKFTFLRENKIIEVGTICNFYKYIYRNLIIANCVMDQDIEFEFWLEYDDNKPFIIINADYLDNKYDLNNEIIEYTRRIKYKGCIIL